MRALAWLVLLPGCMAWSGRLDRYEIVVEDLDAVAVTLEGTDGAVQPLPRGGGEQREDVQVSGHTLTVSRSQREGIRIACETCFAPMILVGPNGRLQRQFDEKELDIAWKSPIVAYRPYYLVREMTWGQDFDWTGSTIWYRETSQGVRVGIEADWQDVQLVTAFQKPRRGLGWGLIALSSVSVVPGFALMNDAETLPIGAAVLAGATFVGWSGWRMALSHPRPVIWYRAGDEHPHIRPRD